MEPFAAMAMHNHARVAFGIGKQGRRMDKDALRAHLWAMTTTVLPCMTRSRASWTMCSESASRAEVASSRRSTRGLLVTITSQSQHNALTQ